MTRNWALTSMVEARTKLKPTQTSLSVSSMNKTPMLVGRALKSTVLIMGEMGSIGSDVLKAHNVHEIDIDAWYPAKLRQEIHEAAYKRFGSAALLNFGFSMGDHYSQATIEASMDRYQTFMKHENQRTDGLVWFVNAFTQAYHEATKASQSCEEVTYGFFARQVTPTCYEFHAISTLLPHHQSFSEGIIRGYLVRYISHHWEFELTFQPEKTQHDAFHSAFFWQCTFSPSSKYWASAEEATATYRLQIKELLFKKVLDESNTALATVMSSVRYARLIQQAQLPQISHLQSTLRDVGVEWHPRDTIGGDFWWSHHHPATHAWVIALIDCTGHGVPGAMLSVLVHSHLDKIFSQEPTVDLASAVAQLDQLVRKSLRQDHADSESDDGCDGAFMRINLSTRTMEFVGARINLYELTAEGHTVPHKADRISLGYRDKPRTLPTSQKWPMAHGSRFVLVTDGVTDQLGGPASAPVAFGYKRLVQAIEASAHVNASTMAQSILQAVTAWQGQQARRDDMTLIVLAP